jgi:hypothetical protein
MEYQSIECNDMPSLNALSIARNPETKFRPGEEPHLLVGKKKKMGPKTGLDVSDKTQSSHTYRSASPGSMIIYLTTHSLNSLR